jgi:hypothetical protein
MPGDYIPGNDAEFNTWQENFLTYASANAAALGLVAADLTPLTAAQAAWASAYSAHVAADAAAASAARSKDGSRATLETGLRALTQRLQSSPTVTDAQRAGLKIPVRSKTRRAAGVPTTRPVATVDTSQRLAHTISFMDEETPTKKAKPAGVLGAEIWVKIGDTPPADPSELSFLALDTNTPYLAEYTGAQAGKKAHYMLRWVSTRGDKGPWSETVSATIPG